MGQGTICVLCFWFAASVEIDSKMLWQVLYVGQPDVEEQALVSKVQLCAALCHDTLNSHKGS